MGRAASTGDDPEVEARVFALVDALGFDPVDGGTFDESQRQHPDPPRYGKDFPGRRAHGRTPKFSA